jgi:hypothetical protein
VNKLKLSENSSKLVGNSWGLSVKVGDIIRLKRPFRPTLASQQTYSWGIVAGLVQSGMSDDAPGNLASLYSEIVVYLYDPETHTTYRDEFETQAFYSFLVSEVEFE